MFAVAALALAAGMLTNPRAQVHAAPLTGDYPVGAVAYLRAHTASTPQPLRLFHDYGWGGYLIAQGYPVFVDGRADPYNTLLDDYVAASAACAGSRSSRAMASTVCSSAPRRHWSRIIGTTPGSSPGLSRQPLRVVY